jgi:hypothetical protein
MLMTLRLPEPVEEAGADRPPGNANSKGLSQTEDSTETVPLKEQFQMEQRLDLGGGGWPT